MQPLRQRCSPQGWMPQTSPPQAASSVSPACTAAAIQCSISRASPTRCSGHQRQALHAILASGTSAGGNSGISSWPGARRPLQSAAPAQLRQTGGSLQSAQHGRHTGWLAAGGKGLAEAQVAAELPDSREQSIQQAAEALAAQLPKEKKGKGAKSSGMKKLAVDVPVADESAAGVVALARDLLDQLPRSAADAFTVVFGNAAAATAAGGSGGLSNPVAAVDPSHDGQLAGPLLVVGATQQQVADVQELLFGWRGTFVVTLNAEWDAEGIADTDLASFIRSFEHVYCFGPLDIQGFFSKRGGCVFKWAKKGSPAAAPWYILSREGDDAWQVVGRQARRPTPGDLEVAFYNAAAANSPLTQGVKFIKGLTGGKSK